MRNLLLLLAFCGLVAGLQAQPIKLTLEKKREIAEERLAQGDTYNALEWYKKVYDEAAEPETAIMIADIDLMLRDYAAAENWYRKAMSGGDAMVTPETRYNFAMTLKHNGKYDEAREHFQKYITNATDATKKALAMTQVAGIELAESMEANDEIVVGILSGDVNTPFTEASPIYAANGDMYYAAIKSSEAIVPADRDKQDFFAKVYMASKSNDAWGNSQPLDMTVNRDGFHNGNVALSKDGNTLYFTRARLEGNKLAESAIYMSSKEGNAWAAPVRLAKVNGDYLAKQPTAGMMDGKEVLYFAANMPSGRGGFDIYYAMRNADGTYGSPKSVGDRINTPGDEVTPFYHHGTATLFFSSDGHPSIGGLDVFSSTYSSAGFSAPENMGLEINSRQDDIYFSADADKFQGFVVSNRPSGNSLKSATCCDDIYAVEFVQIPVDVEVLAVDSKTGEPITGATVMLKDASGATIATKTTTGNQPVTFELERELAYTVAGTYRDYKGDTKSFNTVDLKEPTTISQRLSLVKPVPPPPVEPDPPVEGEIVELSNIYFDFDQAVIRPEAEGDLTTVLNWMNKYPALEIELGAHTDCRGAATYNQQLSQRRATAAKQWLVTRGIADRRIKAVGYGEQRPHPDVECQNCNGCTDDEHELNRRVEIQVTQSAEGIKAIKRDESAPRRSTLGIDGKPVDGNQKKK